MCYVIIMMLLVLIAGSSLVLFKKDYLSPTLVSSVCFFVAVGCALAGLADWNYDSDFSLYTVLIFAVGIISFFIGELLVRLWFKKKKRTVEVEFESKLNKISNPILVFLLLFTVVTTVLLIIEIKKYCAAYGYKGNSFTEMLLFYRQKTGLFYGLAYSSDIKISFIVKQMQKICNAVSIISFVYLLNIIFNKKNSMEKKNKIAKIALIVLIIISCLFQTLLFNGGRSILFHFLVAYLGLFVFYYLFLYKHTINKKALRRVFIVVVILFVLYNLLLPIVGRKTKYNAWTYTTFSIGTSIPSLDLYIKNDDSKSENLGEESFSGIYYSLNKLKIIEYSEANSHEWYSFSKTDDGSLSSNTFTSLRSYYKDFGLAGVALLQLVFGVVITGFYLTIRNRKKELLIIVFFNYFYILIDQIRDEQFFSLINISTIANVLVIIAVYYVLLLIQNRGTFHEKNKKKD